MKKIQAKITLLSQEDKIVVPIQITYDNNEDTINPVSEIDLVYNGIQYKGYGTSYLWEDTFADLQSKLPKDVKIASCMTCRYGNMCPYGNIENQLYCIKAFKTDNKVDLCALFDNINFDKNQKVSSFDYCDDFAYQSKDYFTCNDYLYYLQKQLGNE